MGTSVAAMEVIAYFIRHTMARQPGDEKEKVTYVLEMSSPADHVPARAAATEFEIVQVAVPCPEYNWFLHEAIGVD